MAAVVPTSGVGEDPRCDSRLSCADGRARLGIYAASSSQSWFPQAWHPGPASMAGRRPHPSLPSRYSAGVLAFGRFARPVGKEGWCDEKVRGMFFRTGGPDETWEVVRADRCQSQVEIHVVPVPWFRVVLRAVFCASIDGLSAYATLLVLSPSERVPAFA